jgi:prephenate dehydratase
VDRYKRDGALKGHPLHRNRHAYQILKSTETAIHNAVTRRESAIKYKVIALEHSLTQRELVTTPFDVLTQAAERHGTEPPVTSTSCYGQKR